MTTRLHQIIALRAGAADTAPQQVERLKKELGKTDLFQGLARTYQPIDDEGERQPDQSQRVQMRADDLLRAGAGYLTRLWDLTATLEDTNTRARADVTIPGDETPLLVGVPATTLLFLERELGKLEAFLKALPVLDPTDEWGSHPDPNRGCYVTVPVKTTRSKKIPRNHEMAPATAQHPAQVQVYMEDEVVGYWTLTKFSGALPAARVGELLERLHKLTDAVRSAREEANSAEVTADTHVGEALFGYLMAA